MSTGTGASLLLVQRGGVEAVRLGQRDGGSGGGVADVLEFSGRAPVLAAGAGVELSVLGDVRAFIEGARLTAPVLPASVSATSLAAGAVPLAKLDPATAPLPARLGGSGATSFPMGSPLLVFGQVAEDAFVGAEDFNVVGNVLRLPAGAGLRLRSAGSSAVIRAGVDRHGRRSLFLYNNDSVANRVNLINPRYND